MTAALELDAIRVDGAAYEALLATAGREPLTRLAVHLAREVLDVWRAQYPEQRGPEDAVRAAEAWAACPCALHADAAAAMAAGAGQQALAAWGQPPSAAAWAGRTAAWAADAPKYGWQAGAAIKGACRATSSDRIVAAAEAFFSRGSWAL